MDAIVDVIDDLLLVVMIVSFEVLVDWILLIFAVLDNIEINVLLSEDLVVDWILPMFGAVDNVEVNVLLREDLIVDWILLVFVTVDNAETSVILSEDLIDNFSVVLIFETIPEEEMVAVVVPFLIAVIQDDDTTWFKILFVAKFVDAEIGTEAVKKEFMSLLIIEIDEVTVMAGIVFELAKIEVRGNETVLLEVNMDIIFPSFSLLLLV